MHPVLSGGYSYDFSLPPPVAVLGTILYETATWPPVPSLAIEISLLPSPIVVLGGSAGRGGEGEASVTVADVLETLYVDLQQAAVGYERRGERVARHVPRGTLIASVGQARSRGDVQPVQRGELLRGRHWFVGLSPSEMGAEVYTLHVA